MRYFTQSAISMCHQSMWVDMGFRAHLGGRGRGRTQQELP